MTKRALDILVSLFGLILFSPLFVIIPVLIKMDSSGSVFFRQERMGKQFVPFDMYKFRTMVNDAPLRGGPLTSGGDPRITRVGTILRQTKIDEIPQLINVLKGDMSLVGPRPEVRKYVDLFHDEYTEILKVRPGITDLASLKYRDEAAVLAKAANPEDEYVRHILPDKIRIATAYLRSSSLKSDFVIILKTLLRVISPRVSFK